MRRTGSKSSPFTLMFLIERDESNVWSVLWLFVWLSTCCSVVVHDLNGARSTSVVIMHTQTGEKDKHTGLNMKRNRKVEHDVGSIKGRDKDRQNEEK